MKMHEIHMEVGEVGGSPWVYLDRVVDCGYCPREGHALLFQISLEWRRWDCVTAYQVMLHMNVSVQGCLC